MLTAAANLNKLHNDDTKSIARAIKNGEETKNYKKLCEAKGCREYEQKRESLERKGQELMNQGLKRGLVVSKRLIEVCIWLVVKCVNMIRAS